MKLVGVIGIVGAMLVTNIFLPQSVC